jgi:pimeloyl-ACP methyl ester carboxylesterase
MAQAELETAAEPVTRFVAAVERAGARRTTAHPGGQMVWRVWGQGAPLVLLHGGSGSWLHWFRNIEALSRDFMLVVPDLPGFGESDKPAESGSAAMVAETFVSGLDEILGRQRALALAGFSMGGTVAGHAARLLGDRVATMVLVGSAGFGLKRGPMAPLRSWRRLPSVDEQRAAHRDNVAALMLHAEDKIDDLAVYIQTYGATRAKLRGRDVSASGALAQCLPDLKGRLASIWGEWDATAVPYLDDRREFLRRFQPDAPFEVIAGAGHWVQYEAADEFNRRLCALLSPLASGERSSARSADG